MAGPLPALVDTIAPSEILGPNVHAKRLDNTIPKIILKEFLPGISKLLEKGKNSSIIAVH
jgi:hypothetical protein